MRWQLPIDVCLPNITKAASAHPQLLITAAPGSGKSTRIPPALKESVSGKILMLEPRRVAAKSVAEHICRENSWKLGGPELGYHIRFDRKFSNQTKIRLITEALLSRYLYEDPFLSDVELVIFDEFHERSLHSDIGLALLLELQKEARPDLKIIVTSATLDLDLLKGRMPSAVHIDVPGKTYPKEIRYLDLGPQLQSENLTQKVYSGIQEILKSPQDNKGDILVFLPGVREIESCIRSFNFNELKPMALHSRLGDQEIEAALTKLHQRKVIFSTNIAETSLTIDGVQNVIDSGLEKNLRIKQPWLIEELGLEKISKSSAEQRSGRAARQAPGLCVRLWSAHDHTFLEEHKDADIHTQDLSSYLLLLKDMGYSNTEAFPFIEKPKQEDLNNFERFLQNLDLCQSDGRLTTLGKQCLRWPLHPRVACFLERVLEKDLFIGPQALKLAAAIQENPENIDQSPTPYISKVIQSLENIASKNGSFKNQANHVSSLQSSLIEVFADRVAKRRPQDKKKAVMVGGRGLKSFQDKELPEFFIVLSVREAQNTEAIAQATHSISLEEIKKIGVSEKTFADLDESHRLKSWKGIFFKDLLIQGPHPVAIDIKIQEDLWREWLHINYSLICQKNLGLESFLTRLKLVEEHLNIRVPNKQDIIESWLSVGSTFQRLQEWEEASLAESIQGLMSRADVLTLNREAPERIDLGNGKSKALRYESDGRVFCSLKIQEAFPIKQNPKLMAGKLRVHFELLSPAMRPMQVTSDIESFWRNSYQEIRKELKARYPKHSWPENP